MTELHFEILVEEQSMGAFLQALFNRNFPDLSYDIHSYEGKSNLLKVLPERLAGYRKWIPENYRIIVVVDRDNDDCFELKRRLSEISSKVGLKDKAGSPSKWNIAHRIAIEELEAWYFGDIPGVQAVYNRVPNVQKRAKYRVPDAIGGGTWEQFEKVLQDAGYYPGGLPKIEVARELGNKVDIHNNISTSFNVFIDLFS